MSPRSPRRRDESRPRSSHPSCRTASPPPGTPWFPRRNSRSGASVCTFPGHAPGAPSGSSPRESPPRRRAPQALRAASPRRTPCPRSGRRGSVRCPALWSPFCPRRLPARLHHRAAGEHVPEARPVRRHIENTAENDRQSPMAEPLEHAVPFAEALRKAAPRRSRPDPPERRPGKLSAVRRGDAGTGRLAGRHGFGARPHGVGQRRPVRIHLSFRPFCLRRRSGGRWDGLWHQSARIAARLSTGPGRGAIIMLMVLAFTWTVVPKRQD